ncbi:hypothetical protein DFH09DRAFT_1090806 [Mycena vulgaris]|nr:hypothetical protein DFH09DRAFT_1090806 [Mycena vulgaris]
MVGNPDMERCEISARRQADFRWTDTGVNDAAQEVTKIAIGARQSAALSGSSSSDSCGAVADTKAKAAEYALHVDVSLTRKKPESEWKSKVTAGVPRIHTFALVIWHAKNAPREKVAGISALQQTDEQKIPMLSTGRTLSSRWMGLANQYKDKDEFLWYMTEYFTASRKKGKSWSRKPVLIRSHVAFSCNMLW